MRISYEVLYTLLDEATAQKVCRALKGFTVRFPTKKIEHKDIIGDYAHMRKGGLGAWQAVERLAVMYEKSPTQIWRIVRAADA